MSYRKDKNVWLDNLKELRKAKGNPSYKKIHEDTGVPERTITRIFSGETDNPYIDTVHRLALYFGSSLDGVLADTKLVVGNKDLVALQEDLDAVTAERDLIIAERDLVMAENVILKDKVVALSAENDLLKIQLTHKDEIIALHNYYNKLKPTE